MLAGVQLLDGMEERGRDLRGLLDQVVESIRAAMVGLATHPTVAAHPLTSLVAVARRLAAIDPTRAGVGGLRLQLELALFPDPALAGTRVAPSPSAAKPGDSPPSAQAPPTGPVAEAPVETPAAKATPTEAPTGPPSPEPTAPLAASPGRAPAAKPKPTVAPVGHDPGPAGAEPGPAPAAPGSAPVAGGSLSTPTASGDLAILRDRWAEVVTRISAYPPTKRSASRTGS